MKTDRKKDEKLLKKRNEYICHILKYVVNLRVIVKDSVLVVLYGY